MRDKYFFVEFQIGSQPRFEALRRFFLALKVEKDRFCLESCEETGMNPEELNWYQFLDLEAVEWFSDTFDFQSDEGKTYQKLCELTDPEVRWAHPMFTHPGHWDFDSLIEALFEGEYALIDLIQEEKMTGVLYYDPWAGPFGGTESLVELIESFGNTVTWDSWHEGPHHRRTVGWDFELAKKLVQAGQGFVPK